MSRFFTLFLIALFLIALLVQIFLFSPVIDVEGDAIGYVRAMQVHSGFLAPSVENGMEDVFTIHRLLTTVLGIEAVRLFAIVFGSVVWGWFVWALILFFLTNIVFYHLLTRMFESERVAFVGGLFFAGNYAMVTAGLGQFMDMGGWFFYIVSLYFLYVYIESNKERDVLLAALAIAVGGLFKENAFFAVIPLTAVLLYQNRSTLPHFFRQIIPLGILISAPAVIHHLYIYLQYDYIYTYWYQLNQQVYHYSSRFGEYVKSLGSLLTLLAPISLGGAYLWLREFSLRPMIVNVLVASVLASSIPALMWPGITQRVLFMVVPGATLLACFCIKKYERRWLLFLPALLLYLLASFTMDSFLLPYVNLPF